MQGYKEQGKREKAIARIVVVVLALVLSLTSMIAASFVNLPPIVPAMALVTFFLAVFRLVWMFPSISMVLLAVALLFMAGAPIYAVLRTKTGPAGIAVAVASSIAFLLVSLVVFWNFPGDDS